MEGRKEIMREEVKEGTKEGRNMEAIWKEEGRGEERRGGRKVGRTEALGEGRRKGKN